MMRPCPAPGCAYAARGGQLMCREHWSTVSPERQQLLFIQWLRFQRDEITATQYLRIARDSLNTADTLAVRRLAK